MTELNITFIESIILSIIHALGKMTTFYYVMPLLANFNNNKYPDKRIGRYFFKKYFKINVGKYSFGFVQLMKFAFSSVESIGSFCSIAVGLSVSNGNHPINILTTHPSVVDKCFELVEQYSKLLKTLHPRNGLIIIGNDVWIGLNVTILTSVNIGDGAVIGAGSIVTRDVPPFAIVAGNPAKIIKYRFKPETIDAILKSKWWDRSDDEIRKIYRELYQNVTEVSENHEEEIISCLSKLR